MHIGIRHQLPERDKYVQASSYFYVKFQNVNGLTKSSPVFADGFRVGIVRDCTTTIPNRAKSLPK